ncbi:MAG: LPS export ABC transporter periplasmic protein LptC [Betaproteobacteria bacterium]
MSRTGLAAPLAPAAALARRSVRWLQQGWEATAIYLPVVLMGVLALATYWMVQRTPSLLEPQQAPKVRPHEVDFSMRGAVIRTYDGSGRLQNELAGTEIRHYGDNKTLEVDQPRLLSVSPEARITQAKALKARTQDDGSQVELMGQAVVVREATREPGGRQSPRQELRGDLLIIDTREDGLRSPLPVVLISGQDRFSADSLSYDHRSGVAELVGRVKATLAPH